MQCTRGKTERVWGATRSAATTTLDTGSAATVAENQNIGFDYAYINYMSPIGQFKVGYQNDGPFGTQFGDTSTPQGRITYIYTAGKFQALGVITKLSEKNLSTVNTTSATADLDSDKYALGGIYTDKNIEGGMLAVFYNNATNRTATTPYKGKYYALIPYAKAKIGPVAIQAEIDYVFGKYAEYDTAGTTDVNVNSISGFVDALGTFGPVYVGATFAYAQGQGDDATKINTVANGGRDWNPCLILWNEDFTYWVDATGTNTNKGNVMTNAFLYQVRGGVKPTDKLDIGMSVAFAQQDKTTVANQISKDLGWEIDVTGSYKITNNLSYMLGVGYLIPNDAYKGATAATTLNNTYLVINKLTLSF